jgi:hypothetical protein
VLLILAGANGGAVGYPATRAKRPGAVDADAAVAAFTPVDDALGFHGDVLSRTS